MVEEESFETPYTPEKGKEDKAKTDDLIIEAKKFFDFYKKELGKSIRKGNNVVFLDFMKLTEFSNRLTDEILANPEDTLRIIEQSFEESGLIKNARVRLINTPKSQEIKVRNIRSKHLNEMIVIEGIIRQASDVRPQVVNAKFECPSCGTMMSVLQIEKKFREPPRCSCGRRGGFKLISKEMVDTQRLVVEEAPESLSGGEQPKRINIFVKEDLVEPKMEEKTTPGSRIKIIGVLKEVPIPLQTGGLSTRFELAVEANNVIPMEETFEELDISEEDERQILEMAEDPMIFENLARSITPSIWGYEEIKKSLVLQLFSGVQKVHEDGQKSRGDIHILLIGDPGVAKSVTLGFMANISPKGRYVVGKSASGAGLTATVVRDEYLRGWSLEAGAMVLANKGLVCIDELEKMDPNDRSAMHEAMEQQTITVSKANVQATLRAETSVLAAANPKFGRFDPNQPIAQQIDLPPTLINRFDIIFTLRDIPDREKDERIADHVLHEHMKQGEGMLIPRELFRKYVAYAKQRIKPELSDEAVKEIKSFYIELRNKPVAVESGLRPIPISARQLQALIRMAEASAKIRLSKYVLKKDAINAIDIMKYYLMQVGYDYESKTFDIDRISGKVSNSQRGKIFLVRDTIIELENRIGKMIPTEELEKELEGKITNSELDEAIEKLRSSGEVFSPKRGYIQRTN
ncbi:minichromosome maintenance protein MCM [Candidatus Pacearchaeota archaeon]|jgi:replicative DNA helicase Mcm|nr:minichromosome maintenance protein MCM [Candidatus Pacearchaeota archaeon]